MKVNLFLLQDIDADIFTAATGKEAIEKTIVEDYDLILMDVIMPGIDGFETVELIRRDTRNKFVPVLFISAMPGDELRTLRGLSLGAIDFIIKPASKEILQFKVKNLLELQKYKAALEKTHRELKEAVEEIQLLREETELKAQKGYEILVRASMDGFALIDTKGRILEVNTIYCEMTGYTHDELTSMHIADLEVIEDMEAVKKHIQKVISSGCDRFETILRKKDGSCIPAEVGVRYDQENEQMYVFVKDITLHKELETYIKDNANTQFSNSLCPDCAKKLYPGVELLKTD